MPKKMPEEKKLPSLEELGKKIEKAKRESLGEENKKGPTGAAHVSIELLAGVIAGLLVGYYIDLWFNTKPLFMIICFFLGFAGALRNIIRSVERSDTDKN